MRGSPTPAVDTLHSVAQIDRMRDKSGRMTRPPPSTEIRREKRIRFADVKRICFSDSGASQTVEDLRDRPTAITGAERAKTAVKKIFSLACFPWWWILLFCCFVSALHPPPPSLRA